MIEDDKKPVADAAAETTTDNISTDEITEDVTEGIETADDGPLYGAADDDQDGEADEATDDDAAADEDADAGEESADDLRNELDSVNDRLLRAMAETENLRRRTAREREDAGKYAISGFARDLLSVVDNLRRALDSLSDENRSDESLGGLISGVENTERELLSAFERHGIRRIDPLGEKFDHNLHQAIFHQETSDQPAGTVVEVVQAGYVIADRLLRPAMVGVAKPVEKSEASPDTPHLDTQA